MQFAGHCARMSECSAIIYFLKLSHETSSAAPCKQTIDSHGKERSDELYRPFAGDSRTRERDDNFYSCAAPFCNFLCDKKLISIY